MNKESSNLASPFLEQMLLAGFVIHGLACVSMVLFLLPGMPGGFEADVSARAAYVAAHPWLWRLGWFPWQLTAAFDVLLSLAFLRTRWVATLPAVAGMIVTLLAVIPDQTGELLWVTGGVRLAQNAVRTGDYHDYESFENAAMLGIGGVACILYTLMGVCWSWTLAASGVWSRTLAVLSAATWLVLAVAGLVLFLPPAWKPGPLFVSIGNALGFALLLPWFALVTEMVLRRSRGEEPHGRYSPWRHPRWPRLDWVGNSRFLRALGEWVPPVAFLSDITDVIYVNYIVEADRLEPLVPWGLELQRLGTDRKYAMLSILTYRHGHFGPAVWGPLRGLLPSPVQSNWRIYVRDPKTGKEGIYFFSNAIAWTLHALAARMLSEGMPMHVPAAAAVVAEKDGSFSVHLDPGGGSAPDLQAKVRPIDDRTMPPPWGECFADYRAMLTYTVPQDRALSAQVWYGRVTRQEINLGIPLEACEPVAGEVRSLAAEKWVGLAAPVCFRVARVHFRFDCEVHDPR